MLSFKPLIFARSLLRIVVRSKTFTRSVGPYWYIKNTIASIKGRSTPLVFPVLLFQISLFGKVSENEDNLTKTLKLCDKRYDDMEYDEANLLLSTLIEKNPNNDEVMWRLARIKFEMSKSAPKENKTDILQTALGYVNKAIEINPQNGYAHKWNAIILDATSAVKGIRERIELALQVRDHLLEALKYIPNDGTTHYILGVWYYSIADFTWYERKISSTLNSKFPVTTYQQALEHFQKAEEVEPNFYSRNYLYLGKCYLSIGDKENALKFLKEARDYPQKTSEDKDTHEEAAKLFLKLQG